MASINLRYKAEQIEEEIHRLQTRLDFVRELIDEEEAASRSVGMNGDHTNLRLAVENTIGGLHTPFSKRDIIKGVKRDYPNLSFNEKSVDKPFSYLVRLGEVELLQPSYGSAPALYKRRGAE